MAKSILARYPYMWWDANGASCPELKFVAQLILSHPASAAICGRINSEVALVKGARRNNRGHEKALDYR